MKLKLLCLSLFFVIPSFTYGSIIEIYQPKTGKTLSFQEFISHLPDSGHVVMGEFHNQAPIQNAQAQIINEKVQRSQAFGDFSIHWEFLNHTEQERTEEIFFEFIANLITAEEFISQVLSSRYVEYSPLAQVAKDLQGELRGINLPRKYKQQVIAGGIRSINSDLVPSSHYVGGDRYFERFKKVMRDHVPADKLYAYFVAQCLTDSVMADQISKYSQKRLNFVVAGSFHTDFRDATVVRLEKLTGAPAHTLKFASQSLNTTAEIEKFKSYDSFYGFYADYIVITD